MRLAPTPIAGAFLVEPERHADERGFFARTWCSDAALKLGLTPYFAQSSTSHNRMRGTLRGLHFQSPPFAEAKLVGCPHGAIYDVVVDMRTNSPTHRQWFAAELSECNLHMIYLPEGLAHGFLTLADDTLVSYQISTPHAAGHSHGVRWDDPAIGIDWPFAPALLSERDRSWPLLRDIRAGSDGHGAEARP